MRNRTAELVTVASILAIAVVVVCKGEKKKDKVLKSDILKNALQ